MGIIGGALGYRILFERIVAQSPFRFAEFEAVPIRRLRPLADRLTREVTTATVRCKLVPRG